MGDLGSKRVAWVVCDISAMQIVSSTRQAKRKKTAFVK